MAELEKGPDKKFLQNLQNGATIGYESDLGSLHEVRPDKTKQRVYDEQRRFLGNYKTALGNGGALRKVIDKDLKECLVSRPFTESELR